MKRRIVLWIVASCLVAGVVLASVLLNREPPPPPRVYGTQPALTVTLLPDSANDDATSRVIKAAKDFWGWHEDFWPEPVSVSESDTCWRVGFKWKERVAIRNGKEFVQLRAPDGAWIRVEKSDFACSLMPSQ